MFILCEVCSIVTDSKGQFYLLIRLIYFWNSHAGIHVKVPQLFLFQIVKFYMLHAISFLSEVHFFAFVDILRFVLAGGCCDKLVVDC